MPSSDYLELGADDLLSHKARLLLQTQRYYIKREINTTSLDMYSTSIRTDPDNNTRDLSHPSEALSRLNNLRYLEKLSSLSSEDMKPYNLLDLGCGYCSASRLSFVNEYLGVDIVIPSPSDIHLIQSDRSVATLSSDIESFIDNIEDSRLHEFNLVLLNHVIEHLSEPRRILECIFRRISSDTRIIVATPDFDSAMARRFGRNYRMLHDPTHTSLFTTESLGRFLIDIGFRLQETHFPYFELDIFTRENLLSVFDNSHAWSPPFYGNHVTYVATKP